MIKLVNDTISNGDIDSLIEWLKTYPQLTKGNKTIEFENRWSKWLGVKHSVYVNSGSSANLMILSALAYLEEIKTVAVPALSWATDLAPVMQLGMKPVLIDCNLDDLSVDLKSLEEAFKNEDIDALILVSALGLIPNMREVVGLCDAFNVLLIEDVCESLGSKYRGQKLGTFGVASSFSLYFGHTISTIEGGMISTDNEDVYNILKMLRSHGWSRDIDKKKRGILRKLYDVDKFSELYTFYIPGFNLRATDLQAFIGIEQLNKLDSHIAKRNENFHYYVDALSKGGLWAPAVHEKDFISNHAYPVISPNKEVSIKLLQDAGVEVRPLIAGSMGTQPFYANVYGKEEYTNASIVDSQGFYVPNHPGLTRDDLDKIIRNII